MLIDLTLSIDMNDPIVGKANMDQHSFMSAGHIGTHLDTYLQTTIPPEFHRRQGRLFDVSGLGDEIGMDGLSGQPVREGEFVVFHTGVLEKHGYGQAAYFKTHTRLSWTLIDYLIERKVSFIGIDAAGVRYGEEHGVADRRCEAGGVYIIENLANVGKLRDVAAASEFEVFTGWTGLKGFSGLSCRVIATVDGGL
jgi:kynurenine formamidase